MGFHEDFLLRLNPKLQETIKSKLFKETGESSYCKISDAAKKKILPVIKRLRDVSLSPHEDDSLQTDYIASLLSLFLIDVIRMGGWNDSSIEINSNTYQTYQKFIQIVDKDFKKYHSVEFYLNDLDVSRTYLNICVQQYAKTTPLKFINDRIVLEAKRMIRYSTLSIKEISFDLGFKDVSYFIRLFKRNEGVTPFDFRELNK